MCVLFYWKINALTATHKEANKTNWLLLGFIILCIRPSIYPSTHPHAFFFSLWKEILRSSESTNRKIPQRGRGQEAFSGPIKEPGNSGLWESCGELESCLSPLEWKDYKRWGKLTLFSSLRSCLLTRRNCLGPQACGEGPGIIHGPTVPLQWQEWPAEAAHLGSSLQSRWVLPENWRREMEPEHPQIPSQISWVGSFEIAIFIGPK